MATASDVLRIAAGELGYTRWRDPQTGTKYGRWYAKKSGYSWFGNNDIAYCNMFVTWCLAQAGVPEPSPGHFAYVPYAITAYQKASRRIWKTRDAKPGDLVCFDWNHDGVADHIGIVELNKGTYLQTIEGNTSSGTSGSQSNGGGVYRRTRYWNTVIAILRPNYVAAKPEPEYPAHYITMGSKGERVRALQKILARVVPGHYTETIDGVFGNHTRNAVTKFQAAQGLTPDGIVGDKTISALADLGWFLPPLTARSKYPNDWLVYGDQGEQVKRLQKRLLTTVPGLCEHASVDGDYGLWTMTTVCRLQRAFGLYPDGMAGPKTLALLDRIEGEKP